MKHSFGYTLVEIMVVVAVIGLLASIATPHFIRTTQVTMQNTCINNLRLIAAAKDEWAMDNNTTSGADIVHMQLTPYFKHGIPLCPRGTAYKLGPAGADPVCISYKPGIHPSTL